MSTVDLKLAEDIAINVAIEVIKAEPSVPARTVYAFVAGYYSSGVITTNISQLTKLFFDWWYC